MTKLIPCSRCPELKRGHRGACPKGPTGGAHTAARGGPAGRYVGPPANEYIEGEGKYAGLPPAQQPNRAPQFVYSTSESDADGHIAVMQEPDGPRGYLEAASHIMGRPVDSIRDLTDDEFASLQFRSTPASRPANHTFSRDRDGNRYVQVKAGWEDPGNPSSGLRYERGPRDRSKARWQYGLI